MSSSNDECPYNGKVFLAAIISLSAAISFVLLLHLFAKWLLQRRAVVVDVIRESLHLRSSTSLPETSDPPVCGLDAKVVALLPMFVYRSEEHGVGLGCVVCQSAMEEGDKGRILPNCKHAFHVGCIDMWLVSHSTCPICRAPMNSEEMSAMVDASTAIVSMVVDGDGEARAEPRRTTNEDLGVASEAVEGQLSVEVPCSSLKRMLTKNRPDHRVFPSVL